MVTISYEALNELVHAVARAITEKTGIPYNRMDELYSLNTMLSQYLGTELGVQFEDAENMPPEGHVVHGVAVSDEELRRERLALIGELRHVQIDVGSFLAMTTEATEAQRLALASLVHRYQPSCRSVYVTIGGAGLPGDYVLFELRGEDAQAFLTGGIDPEGRVST